MRWRMYQKRVLRRILRPRLMPRLALAGLALICASFDARAAISVDHAGYKGGILTVDGHTTKAHQTVTLDGIYRAARMDPGASDSASATGRSTARCVFDPARIFFTRQQAIAVQCDELRNLSTSTVPTEINSRNSAICERDAAEAPPLGLGTI